MTTPRIFITQPVAQSALDRIRTRTDITMHADSSKILTKDALIEAVRNTDILYCLLHDTVDRDVLIANPQLRAVASQSITPDRIDVEAATELGIPVTVVPAVVTDATADIAFALVLSVARRILEGDKLVRSGGFPGAQSAHLLGADVSGKTIGLIGGKGRIGQAVGRRAQGFDMRVLYWGPRRLTKDEEQAANLEYMDFDDLLAASDFISLHAAMSPETHHSMSTREFKLMKSTAFIINTARGPVIDEKALVIALQTGEIAGAGLDVFENEPDVESPLLTMKNVVLTPHLGSAAHDVREGMAHRVVDNIVAFLDGTSPPNCANPQVLSDK
jgi:glyoxylate reductase